MDRAPSSSGETTGSVRARGGYDAYFGSQEQSDTGSTWRQTVAGRSHQPPVPPFGRPLPSEPGESESPDAAMGPVSDLTAAGPDPAARTTPAGGEADSRSHGGSTLPGGEPAPGHGGTPQQSYRVDPAAGYGTGTDPGGMSNPASVPPAAASSYDPYSDPAPSAAPRLPAGPATSAAGTSATATTTPAGGTYSTPLGSVGISPIPVQPDSVAAPPAALHSAPPRGSSPAAAQSGFNSAPTVQNSHQRSAPPATLTPSQSGHIEPAAYQALPISLTSNELLADIAASRQAQLRSTTGVRGALNKVGFNIGLSPTELRTEHRHARIRRQLGAAYQVAVLNVKGGVGRTTTVAALGATFASLRPDRVAAIDANPDFGDLAARTSRHPFGLTLRDLAQERYLDAFAAVQSFASITNSDLAVVSSPWSPAAVEALSGSEYLAATETLRKHYNLLLVDCGTSVLGSAASAVLESSDSVVLVTPATVRGVTGAVATLEWLNAHGQYRLAANSTIAIVLQHPSKPVVEVARIEELFATAQRPSFLIPYDPHLAEGGEIDLRLLDNETALAFEELAATVADGFPDSVMTGYGRSERGGRQ